MLQSCRKSRFFDRPTIEISLWTAEINGGIKFRQFLQKIDKNQLQVDSNHTTKIANMLQQIANMLQQIANMLQQIDHTKVTWRKFCAIYKTQEHKI